MLSPDSGKTYLVDTSFYVFESKHSDQKQKALLLFWTLLVE